MMMMDTSSDEEKLTGIKRRRDTDDNDDIQPSSKHRALDRRAIQQRIQSVVDRCMPVVEVDEKRTWTVSDDAIDLHHGSALTLSLTRAVSMVTQLVTAVPEVVDIRWLRENKTLVTRFVLPKRRLPELRQPNWRLASSCVQRVPVVAIAPATEGCGIPPADFLELCNVRVVCEKLMDHMPTDGEHVTTRLKTMENEPSKVAYYELMWNSLNDISLVPLQDLMRLFRRTVQDVQWSSVGLTVQCLPSSTLATQLWLDMPGVL
jgi:hypothetical protein